MQTLATLIIRHAPKSGIGPTVVPRLSLIRADAPTVPVPAVYEASLCLIAQGAKRVSLGEHSVVYNASKYLLVSVDLPLVGHVIEAGADAPYLCCKFDLDLPALADMMIAEKIPAKSSDLNVLAVYPSDPDLVDAACRLVSLIERPQSVPTLAPLIEREILYRLLTGPHGPLLRHMTVADSHLGQVTRAIGVIRGGYQRQLRIDDIAAAAGMSPSSLFAHFKAITRLTPLEYQKHLRLQEARRLMLTEGVSAGSAGYTVGYESESQFSREYRRLFGAPPGRDIANLRNASGVVTAV